MHRQPAIVAKESYCSENFEHLYAQSDEGDKHRIIAIANSQATTVSSFWRNLKNIFLPHGYPHTVSDDYLQYQLWDTLQAFCSSITGTLATQAVLKGVGVGDENATVLAATLTWLLKDGTGMVGRIWFAWLKGSQLDCDCKRWRLFADVLNDFAMFLEISAPYFSVFFTPIICTAGICKSIVGVAGGATRAALTQHQALRNNMADVSAKDGSQETLVNLAGLLCNLLLIPIVTGNQSLVWMLFLLFTCLHLLSNFMAVKSVRMSTFNQTRLGIVVHDFLENNCYQQPMIVKEANHLEPVLFGPKRYFHVHLGHSIKPVMKSLPDFLNLVSIYNECSYLVHLENGHIYIILSPKSTPLDQLRACFQVEVMEWAFHKACLSTKQEKMNFQLSTLVSAARITGNPANFVAQTHFFSTTMFPQFLHDVQSLGGWKPEPVLLCADEWRAQWNPEDLINSAKGK